jgi:hypothetical protein
MGSGTDEDLALDTEDSFLIEGQGFEGRNRKPGAGTAQPNYTLDQVAIDEVK